MSLTARATFLFFAGLPIGVLTLRLFDAAPLTSLEMNPEPDGGLLSLLQGIILVLLGIVDGFYNRKQGTNQLVQHQNLTSLSLFMGITTGLFGCAYPMDFTEFLGRLVQLPIAFASLVYFYLAHIAGADVYEKRDKALTTAHPP